MKRPIYLEEKHFLALCLLLLALVLGCLLPEPEVAPKDIYIVPSLEEFYRLLDGRYDDFQMMPTYGVTKDARIYIAYTHGGGFFIDVFQVIDGTWEWVDTIEVEQRKGGPSVDKRSKSRRESASSQ